MKTRSLFLLILGLLCFPPLLYSQNLFQQNIDPAGSRNDLYQKRTQIGVSFGGSLELGNKRNGSVRLFLTAAFMHNVGNSSRPIILGGQTEFEIFRGGLGASVAQTERTRLQLELRNSVQIQAGKRYTNNTFFYVKPAFQSVGYAKNALFSPFQSAIALGTTFINGINHKRNQQLGYGIASVANFQLYYYNDATPFNTLFLADAYDRYWTGGGELSYNFSNKLNGLTSLALRYDNYTGYQRNLYEIASMLKLDNLPYKDKGQQMFNQARWQYRVGIDAQYFANVSVYEPIATDVQYFIHYYISNSPFHVRPLPRRVTVGVDYLYRNPL